MNKTGFVKYKLFRMKKPFINVNIFTNMVRGGEQTKLIKKIKQSGVVIRDLKINWDYVSQNEKLNKNFIKYFQEYINFDKLSINKNLKIKYIRKFHKFLNWDILSKSFKFELEELIEFRSKVNWKYIFFFQNLTKNNIEKYFRNEMWWLFLDDTEMNGVNMDYHESNDLVINKNIRTIPINLVDTYNKKLIEYTKNKEQLKETLKTELVDLINSFESSGDIKRMMSIQIHLKNSENSTFIDVGCQTEPQYDTTDLLCSFIQSDEENDYFIEDSVEEIYEEL